MTANQTLVYVTYIATTPEKVWKALIDGELTRQYWKHENVSDWKPGSRWEHVGDDAARTVKIVGKVLDVVPNKRLLLTWVDAGGGADSADHSRVIFEVEPVDDMVRLTVIHEELRAGSEMLRKVNNGWPWVLSSLKSFLETGKPLKNWPSPHTTK
jgi:uncharacterized protein YndB with AHSA1/START domain